MCPWSSELFWSLQKKQRNRWENLKGLWTFKTKIYELNADRVSIQMVCPPILTILKTRNPHIGFKIICLTYFMFHVIIHVVLHRSSCRQDMVWNGQVSPFIPFSVPPFVNFLLECITLAAMYYFRMTQSEKSFIRGELFVMVLVLFVLSCLWWSLSLWMECTATTSECWQKVDLGLLKKMYICTTTTSEGWQKVDLSLLMANWKKCSWCTTGGPSPLLYLSAPLRYIKKFCFSNPHMTFNKEYPSCR